MSMTPDQIAAAESLPQPASVIQNAFDGSALVVDAHGDAHNINQHGEMEDGTRAHYVRLTDDAHDAAAAISRHVRREHLGDVCYGVAITRPDRPGWIAILATDPDDPANGWGVYTGPEEREFDGTGWEDVPAAWGTNPKTIGAMFARKYGRAR